MPDASCDEYAARIKATGTPSEKCRAYVAMARCILVVECAPPLSDALRGDHNEALARRAAEGLKNLQEASDLLAGMADDDEPADADELRRWIDLLQSFGGVFAALGGQDGSTRSNERLIDACGGLALYFDDSKKEIAESAKFWQGVAYRRAGRPERALQVLRPAIASPESGRIGLLSRLERCRALADRAEYAAAIALTMRLASRVDTWLDAENEETRRQAADSVQALRVELFRGWAAKLQDEKRQDQADAALAEAKKLTRGEPGPPRGLALAESIAGVSSLKSNESPPSTQEDEP